MARKLWTIGFSLMGLALVGCIPQEKYNAMRLSHDAAVERLAQAEAGQRAAEAAAEAYRRQVEAINASGNNQSAMVASLTSQLNDFQNRYAELNQKYEAALAGAGQFQTPLPEAVNDALTEFAQQNPNLVEFDSARGIVKFKSDVTFATGKDELKPDARSAIARFAQILNSPAASAYELQVAGHTDSQRVSNAATIKAGHKDNWYLSSHRAISVGRELQNQRVDSRRIAVVGYADQHPIASNANESGRQQNRRVEVLILPSQVRSTPAPSGGETTADRGGEGANKDSSVNVDRGPAFEDNNK